MNLLRNINWLAKKSLLNRIKLVVLDVDGVLTDGYLWFTNKGEITKKFSVRDGLGIRMLQANGIEIAFLSGGVGGASEQRAKQLNIKKIIVEAKDKELALKVLQEELKIRENETVFVGDDVNDLVVKNSVSLLIAPNDASNILKKKADLVLTNNGGNGVVRELAERIKNKGWWSRNWM